MTEKKEKAEPKAVNESEVKNNAELKNEIAALLERIKGLEEKNKSTTVSNMPTRDENIKRIEEQLNKKVKVKLFKDGKDYKDDVFVAINGVSYQIKRGVEVEIPLKVAQLLDRAQIQSIKAAELIDEKVKEFAAQNI